MSHGRLFLQELFGENMSKQEEQQILDICETNLKEMDEFVNHIAEMGDISVNEMAKIIQSFEEKNHHELFKD